MSAGGDVIGELRERFPQTELAPQVTADGIPTLWTPRAAARDVLRYLKVDVVDPYRTLLDLTAIDERTRAKTNGLPPSDFTVVYLLISYTRNSLVRLKVALLGDQPSIPSVTDLWASAAWYEREVWDMFGIGFEGHANMRRILLPYDWVGHPLRKEYPARATETGPFVLTPEKEEIEQQALQVNPAAWGLKQPGPDEDFMYLNFGPQHPSTHGPFRVILQLDGEQIVGAIPDIGYHHRGQEKMAERQSWHTYLPYTDRIDYLSGVVNELAYCLSVERLAGIEVPERARVIRVMMTELYRIASHLVWYGTFAADVGQLSPVFYMFSDREKVYEIVEAICGARMHPVWFRIGGVAQDLPDGWEGLIRGFLDRMPARLHEYDKMVMENSIFKDRTVGVGACTLDEAIEWGMTGPNLRSCGLEYDFRKRMTYSGYDQFEFDIPTATEGDCYARSVVRIQEMWQSLRIIEQCLNNMPAGPYKSSNPLTTPPIKDPNTMHDIETLINHFLNVTWGPVIPPGECFIPTEASKGCMGFYEVSDGDIHAYRSRVRTPSFANLQTLPWLVDGTLISDMVATLGSLDFVVSDVDR
ncbi:MAG TPA: NADH-quinone oxidoreductase subunit C/D [Chloroflexota bacterium]